MEILAPASNMEHIQVAINDGANAVYGGLKNWNARNKAINFNTDEYNEVIKILHKNDIKFFLTLNILILDDEIEEIISFLSNNELPDAFIVADIGLIKKLQQVFPTIPIHLSTQFGTHNMEDVRYAESLGASRAILARELTLDEVNNIRKNTKIELETFIWGSQCLSFSGLCFFGTIINGGGGNRGKCMITCRDVYSISGETGHYLYVPDMDTINLIEKLKNIDCLKLEGRRRNPKEISTILSQIKEEQKSKINRGYLFGDSTKQNGLYEKINSRIKGIYKINELTSINENDVFVEFHQNGEPIKFSNNKIGKNIKYVYSEIKMPYIIDKKNISIDFVLDGEIVKEALYVNYKGDGHTYFGKKEDYITFKFNDLKAEIEKKNEKINVYKLKYIRTPDDNYRISKNLYKEIVDSIVNDCAESIRPKFENKNFKLNSIYLETTDALVIDEFINDRFVKIIYNITSIVDFINIEKIINKYNDKLIYKLPLFNWQSKDLFKYYKLLENKEVMFTRLSQIYTTKDIKFKKKYIDYTIYVWNKVTLQYLLDNGIDEFTASPELSYNDNIKIFKKHNFQMILGGNLPMVFTRNCFSHLYKCQNCLKNQNHLKSINNEDKKMKFKIICKNDYRMIINKSPILNDFSKINFNNQNVSYRYISLGQDLDTIKETVNTLKQKNYYDKLLKTKIWKNSYECNLYESKK